MFDTIRKLVASQREFLIYCIIGCSGVLIDYVVFAVLTDLVGMHYQVANVISVSMGISNNFIWNVRFNFKVKDRIFLRFCSFYGVGMIGLAISAALLYLFVEIMSMNALVSKLAIIFIVTMVQFTLNKCVTFRKRGVK